MLEFGIILIGTGLIVLLYGRRMVSSANKMASQNSSLGKEYSKLVKRGMRVLDIVGITLIVLGIIMATIR